MLARKQAEFWPKFEHLQTEKETTRMSNQAQETDALMECGLRKPIVTPQADAIMEEMQVKHLARLIATLEGADLLDVDTLRAVHGYKVIGDPSTVGDYVMSLKAVDEVIAAQAATDSVDYTKELGDVDDSNMGGPLRRQLVGMVEKACVARAENEMKKKMAEELKERKEMERQAEEDAAARAAARLAAGATGLTLAGLGGAPMGTPIPVLEMPSDQEQKLNESFRDMYAFDLTEGKRANAAGLRTMEKYLVEQRRWPSDVQQSYLKLKSGEGGGAKLSKLVEAGDDGTLTAGVKEEEAEDPKGAWRVVKLYSRKLFTALLVGHNVKAWAGYTTDSAGKVPKDANTYIIAYAEVLGLVEMLEAGAEAGVKGEAMKAFVQHVEREIRAKMVGVELCTPGCAIARVTAQGRGQLALSVGPDAQAKDRDKGDKGKEKEKNRQLAAAQQQAAEYKRKLAALTNSPGGGGGGGATVPGGGGGSGGPGAGGPGAMTAGGGVKFPKIACRHFAKTGQCMYGKDCRFSHATN